MYPEKQVFFVLGLSRSGCAAAEFLLSHEATVYIYDDLTGERVEQAASALVGKGAKRVLKEDVSKMSDCCDALVLSPGIPIDHPLAVSFKRKGKAVVGESEIAARFMRCPVLAVTGTNGKTTTVSMLTEVLCAGGYEAHACGNIGTPMTKFSDLGKNGVAVAEISSFQLETLNSLCPHIAVILNVTEDHLNRHYNMENYIFLKAKLLKNSSEAEYAVLNYDDPIVRGFAEKTKAKTVWFSIRERVRGAYLENGSLFFGNEKIADAGSLLVEGVHNLQNALATIAAAKLMGVKNETIASALAAFKGIRHRIEWVAEVDGVTYVDDSKGTNVDATLKAVGCMKNDTILLLGGKNKGYDYTRLFAMLGNSKVVHAVLYGENRFELLKCARERSFEKVSLCDTFAFALRVATMRAERGQTVLLSPASASFDEFTSYEERGDAFVEFVQSLQKEESKEEVPNVGNATTEDDAGEQTDMEDGDDGADVIRTADGERFLETEDVE